MPFKSEAQRRYLWMHEPAVAQKWANEYPEQKGLPKHMKKPAMKRAALLSHMKGSQ